MNRLRPRQIALALAVCLAACDSGSLPSTLPTSGTGKSLADSRQPLEIVTDGILGALNRPAVRVQMIALLRASPWVEHKVSLAEAMAGSGGSLRRESAAAVGLNENDFAALLSGLPAMDFYVADPTQRRSWRGEGEVRLAVSSDGKTFVTRGGSGTGAALFALHPAEPKGYRIGRQGPSAGAVIEDKGDGGGGLNIEFVNRNGEAVSIDVGASGMTMEDLGGYLAAQGGPIAPVEGGPARTGGTLTAVEYVANVQISDGVGSAEIEWKAWKYIGGSGSNEYKLRWTGVYPYYVLLSNAGCGSYSACIPYALQMWSWVPSSGQSVRGEFWETDTGADDHYGTLYWSDTEGGVTKTSWGGPDVCFNGSYQYACADARVNYY